MISDPMGSLCLSSMSPLCLRRDWSGAGCMVPVFGVLKSEAIARSTSSGAFLNDEGLFTAQARGLLEKMPKALRIWVRGIGRVFGATLVQVSVVALTRGDIVLQLRARHGSHHSAADVSYPNKEPMFDPSLVYVYLVFSIYIYIYMYSCVYLFVFIILL